MGGVKSPAELQPWLKKCYGLEDELIASEPVSGQQKHSKITVIPDPNEQDQDKAGARRKGKDRVQNLGQDEAAVSTKGKERAGSVQRGEDLSRKVGLMAKGKAAESAPGELVLDDGGGGVSLTFHRR